jgi:hypothetical protein
MHITKLRDGIYVKLLFRQTIINVIYTKTKLSVLFRYIYTEPSWPWSYCSWIYNYRCNQFLSPLKLWVRISIRARCTTLCDTVCQWFWIGRCFSLGPPVSPTNKTDCHDITEILLALNTKQTKTSSIYGSDFSFNNVKHLLAQRR